MIGALISLLSLETTRRLVAGGLVAGTLTVVGATDTTPIVVTVDAATVFRRPVHGVVSGITGNTAANGLWVLTPVSGSQTQFALSTYDSQGAVVESTGSGVYVAGGTIQYAFPDGSILLGRRNIPMLTAVATPRIVFVPMGSPAWELDPYGGIIPPASLPRTLSAATAEQQTMKLQRQLTTERQKFEVHVTGCATPPDPDFGDFDVTQAVYQTLYGVMFDLVTPDRAKVLSGTWASQTPDATGLDKRGERWVGIVEIAQPVTDQPLSFLPTDTVGTLTVNFAGGASADQTIIVVPVAH